MKKGKKMFALLGVLGVLLLAGGALAAGQNTPAGIVAELTGKSVQDVTDERAAGKTYGTIANDAGKLDEFKAQMLEEKKGILAQRVEAGTLTQAQADEFITAMENNQLTCDGTGNAGIGKKICGGAGRGMGFGQGRGNGSGNGNGSGHCGGTGFGRQQ